MHICTKAAKLFPNTLSKLLRPIILQCNIQQHVFAPCVLSKRIHNVVKMTEEERNNRLLELWSCGVGHFGKLKMNLPFDIHVKSLDPELYPDMNKVIIKLLYSSPEMPSNDESPAFLSSLTKLYELNIDTHNSLTPEDITIKGRWKAMKIPILCFCEIPIKFDLEIACEGDSAVVQQMENDNVAVEAKSCTLINTKSGTVTVTCKEGDLICQKLLQGNIQLQAKGNANIQTDRLQGTEITCSTEKGNITASSVYCSEASFSSQDGNVKLTNCHCDTRIHVSNGDLKIDSFEGNLEASVKGSTDIYVTRPEQITVRSEKGDINMQVGQEISSNFDLKGKLITVDNKLNFKEENSTETNQQKIMTGYINGKDATVSLETMEGNINLKQQDWLQSLNLKFQSE